MELYLFQHTFPHRAKLTTLYKESTIDLFQLTLPRREQSPDNTTDDDNSIRFNSRSHVGSDKINWPCFTCSASFNSRSHIRSDVIYKVPVR